MEIPRAKLFHSIKPNTDKGMLHVHDGEKLVYEYPNPATVIGPAKPLQTNSLARMHERYDASEIDWLEEYESKARRDRINRALKELEKIDKVIVTGISSLSAHEVTDTTRNPYYELYDVESIVDDLENKFENPDVEVIF